MNIMGNTLRATCKCGFKKEFLGGGGFHNFQTFCGAPGYCETCKKFVLGNYLDSNVKCPDCGKKFKFYNDASLQKPTNKTELIFSWNTNAGEFKLPDTTYLCGNCGKFNLKFENTGNWD
jgi:DNA-directed RNA polymerase subunit RPC12/RpoP